MTFMIRDEETGHILHRSRVWTASDPKNQNKTANENSHIEPLEPDTKKPLDVETVKEDQNPTTEGSATGNQPEYTHFVQEDDNEEIRVLQPMDLPGRTCWC